MNNEDKRIFTAPAYISGISTMKDRTIKLSVYIPKELPPEEMATLFGFDNTQGYILFAGNVDDLNEADIPAYNVDIKGTKSYSERIRGALYRLWESKGKVGTSKAFYDQQQERYLDKIKEQI